jgi:hypothetical protein
MPFRIQCIEVGVNKEETMVFFLGLACLIGGFIVVMPLFMDKYPSLRTFDEKLAPYKIIIGLAILIIGIITFVVPYHGGGRPLIPVFGDFLPSVLAILLGTFISIDFLETLKGVRGSFPEKLKKALMKYQFPIGFAGIFFGIFHWILHNIVFF